MIIVCYDISDNKLRTRFSKFLEQHGFRLQYSVFELNHSNRILNVVKETIEHRFSKRFTPSDSVLIFTADNQKVIKYGSGIHIDQDLIIV